MISILLILYYAFKGEVVFSFADKRISNDTATTQIRNICSLKRSTFRDSKPTTPDQLKWLSRCSCLMTPFQTNTKCVII